MPKDGISASNKSRKTKQERAKLSPFVQSRRLQIEEIIAEERQKENNTVSRIVKATVLMTLGQVNVDIEIGNGDEFLMPTEIKTAVDSLIEQGFTPRTYSARDKVDNLDKKGTVTGVKPVEGTKMFEVTGSLDDNGGEFKWREFTATTFRKGDRFKVIKNDRGFKAGQLVIDDGEQTTLAF